MSTAFVNVGYCLALATRNLGEGQELRYPPPVGATLGQSPKLRRPILRSAIGLASSFKIPRRRMVVT